MSYRTYIAASRAAYIAGIEAGIAPQELRAHTGVIGEAFVAEYLGVKLASVNNQRGYDVVDGDGLRVSVKTITTSTHATFNASTMDLVDRVIVVWIGTEADELDVVIVYDKGVDDLLSDCANYRGTLRLGRSSMVFPNKPDGARTFEVGPVVDSFENGGVTFRKHSSGSFTVLVEGEPQPAYQYLRNLRDSMGLPEKTNDTTRSMGAQVFSNLRT
ncbi:hypothetical protein [Roseivivax marinus]|uniref:hypothetical protein n=1 Tax=Roseivivax marinus TaxID=1379903 RepID=UPI00103B3C00|nr:hypothetical protein [Roseivivax marinus]